ncbi:MAG: hypothetical protein FJ135_03220 [Deltaproteobacteria bacterium]|nr:hypothetical protein [Deltaproteobacteria bacterium]
MKRSYAHVIPFIIMLGMVTPGLYGAEQNPGKDSNDLLAVKENYFPLQEGWTWEYQCNNFDATGKKTWLRIVARNLSQYEVAGQKVTPRQIIKYGTKISVEYGLFRENYSGVLKIGAESQSDATPWIYNPPRYYLKYPVIQNTTWEYDANTETIRSDNGKKTVTRSRTVPAAKITVENINQTIKVPAGTFDNCMKIREIRTTQTESPRGIKPPTRPPAPRPMTRPQPPQSPLQEKNKVKDENKEETVKERVMNMEKAIKLKERKILEEKYKDKNKNIIDFCFYFAPGVGLIKFEHNIIRGGKKQFTSIWELVSYKKPESK